jgi:hypothetical protein
MRPVSGTGCEGPAPGSPDTLAATLGPAAGWWTALLDDLGATAGDITEAWACSSPKTGWSMRVQRGERVLAYLTPQADAMLVGVVLGEKAITAATAAGLVSERARAVLEAAPRYAEGRGVRITLESGADLAVAKELLQAKLST